MPVGCLAQAYGVNCKSLAFAGVSAATLLSEACPTRGVPDPKCIQTHRRSEVRNLRRSMPAAPPRRVAGAVAVVWRSGEGRCVLCQCESGSGASLDAQDTSGGFWLRAPLGAGGWGLRRGVRGLCWHGCLTRRAVALCSWLTWEGGGAVPNAGACGWTVVRLPGGWAVLNALGLQCSGAFYVCAELRACVACYGRGTGCGLLCGCHGGAWMVPVHGGLADPGWGWS